MTDYKKILLNYFGWKGWPVQVDESENLIRIKYQVRDETPWDVYIRYIQDRKIILFYTVLPNKIPIERRYKGAEFITRANFGLNVGNFEMDWEDGEIRFRTSIVLGNMDFDYSLIDEQLMVNLITTEDYYKGLIESVVGNEEPSRVIRDIRERINDIDFDF